MPNSSAPTDALTRAVREVTDQAGREKHVTLTLRCKDGTEILGQSMWLEGDSIIVVIHESPEDGNTTVVVPVGDVESIVARSPRRGREAALAAVVVLTTVALLTLASTLDWVRPIGRGELTIGLMLVLLAALGAFELLFTRTRLRDWLVRWRQAYPPP